MLISNLNKIAINKQLINNTENVQNITKPNKNALSIVSYIVSNSLIILSDV